MRLEIDNKFLVLKDLNKKEKNLLRSFFTFSDFSNAFAGGSFNKRKIKKICLLKNNKLFSGFLFSLCFFLKQNKIKVKIEDKREKIEKVEIEEFLPNFSYNEHQKNALERMIKLGNGIIVSPTGSGKTEIFISFIKAINKPTLIIVNRKTLAEQIKERFGPGMGICYSGIFEENKHMVSTIQSVNKIKEKFDVLILDEVHRASSNSYQEFLDKNSSKFKFGFSATPFSKDKYKNALIEQHIGNVIYEVDINKMIDKKVIVKPKISFVDINCEETIDWPTANKKCIIENKERNEKIRDLVNKEKQTLILIRNIEHGKILNDLIDNSVFVSGSDDVEKRIEIINKFEKKEINTIISTNIFNEGISIPSIDQIIIGSGGKSEIEAIQKIGRGLRSHKEKDFLEVIDFFDKGNRFTERHSKERKHFYRVFNL